MRTALIGLIIVAALLTIAIHLHTYSAANAGVFIDLPAHHWCGFEYRGSIGTFCDVS